MAMWGKIISQCTIAAASGEENVDMTTRSEQLRMYRKHYLNINYSRNEINEIKLSTNNYIAFPTLSAH